MKRLYIGRGNWREVRFLPWFRFRMQWPRAVRTFNPWDRWDPLADIESMSLDAPRYWFSAIKQ